MEKKQSLSIIVVLLVIIGFLLVYALSVTQRSKVVPQEQEGQTQSSNRVTQSSQPRSPNTAMSSMDKILKGPIVKINKNGDKITSITINADISAFNLGEKTRMITLDINNQTHFYNLQVSSKNAPLSPDKLKKGDTVLVKVSSSTKELIPKGQDTFTALKISR